MNLSDLFQSDTSLRLGWVLLHSLWQLAAIGLLAAIVRPLLAGRLQSRYRLSYAMLILMALAPVTTWFLSSPTSRRAPLATPVATQQSLQPVKIPSMPDPIDAVADAEPGALPPPVDLAQPPVPASEQAIQASASADVSPPFYSQLLPYSAWLTPLWLGGVVLLALRQLGGWVLTRRIVKGATPIADASVQARLDVLATNMGIRRAVQVLQSGMADVPMVIGSFRPVIVLPLSLLTGLSPAQCEAIFAHELAHIRRYDFLFNIFQLVIETLLFYHPAIWWLSRGIRADREFCCDDLVTQFSGHALALAEGLVAVEAARLQPRSVPMAVTAVGDGRQNTTYHRILRLLNAGEQREGDRGETGSNSWIPGSVVILVVALISVGWGLSSLLVRADIDRDSTQTTVVVEWSALVDETVLREIRLLKSNRHPTTAEAEAETIYVSADELRLVIEQNLDDERKAFLGSRFDVIRPSPPAFRPTGIARSGGNLKHFRDEEEVKMPISVSWGINGFAYLESNAEAANLRLKMNYSFTLSQSHKRFPVETTESIDDGRAVAFVVTPQGTSEWRPSLLVVYEAVSVPKGQLDYFKPHQPPKEWIRFGPTDAKKRSARIRNWNEIESTNINRVNPDRTRDIPNGGHVQLVGISRPRLAPMIWWTPTGQPISASDLPDFVVDWEQDAVALVRIWEEGRQRSVQPLDMTRWANNIIDLPDKNADGLGSQLLIVPIDIDPATGKPRLKLGIGTGDWTQEVILKGAEGTTATINDVEMTFANFHEFKSDAKTDSAFRWQPTPEWEFTALAITKTGRQFADQYNPVVYANEPPNTVNGAMFYRHPLLANEIDHFIIKSRPTHWVEFDDFVIEPAIPLNPALDFALQSEDIDEAKPAAAEEENEGENQSASNTNEPADDNNKTRLLADAIRDFNEQSEKDTVGKDQPPLTENEVITAIQNVVAKRDQYEVTDAEFADFQKITETRIFPSRVEFEALSSFQPDPLTTITRWSVRIVMPRHSSGGTYAFNIRDTHIDTHKIDEKTIAWGKPGQNGLAYGVAVDPHSDTYQLYDAIQPLFFIRNEGSSTISFSVPNVLFLETKNILAIDDEGKRIDVKRGDKEFDTPWVAGWQRMALAPGKLMRLRLPHTIGLGAGVYDDKVGRILDVKPDQKYRLAFEIPNYGNSSGREILRTGEIVFNILPAKEPDSENNDKPAPENKPATETNDKEGDDAAKQTTPAEKAESSPTKTRVLHKPNLVLPDSGNTLAVRFDNNNQELVAVSVQQFASIQRRDIATQKLKSEVALVSDQPGRPFQHPTATLSQDCQRVAIATDEYVGIWDTSTGKLLKKLPIPKVGEHWVRDVVKRLTCSADLSVIVAGMGTNIMRTLSFYDAYAVVWDGATGEVMQTISHKHAREFVSIDLSSDGKLLATTGGGGTVVWDTTTGKQRREIKNDNQGRKHSDPEVTDKYLNHVWSVQFSPDGKQVAIGDTLGVKLWDVATGRQLQQLDGPYRYSSGHSTLVFSNDGRHLARVGTSSKAGGIVPIWSTQTGQILLELNTKSEAGVFSDNGQQFAVVSSDSNAGLAIWQLHGNSAKLDAANNVAPKSWQISQKYDPAWLRHWFMSHEVLPEPITVPAVRGQVVDQNGAAIVDAVIRSHTPRQWTKLFKGGVQKTSPDQPFTRSNAQGRFGIPQRTEPYRVLVTHESGVASLTHEELINGDGQIVLQPWARIEGTYTLDGEIQPGKQIVLRLDTLPWSYSRGGPRLTVDYKTTTDAQGQYSFESVPPLAGRVQAYDLIESDNHNHDHPHRDDEVQKHPETRGQQVSDHPVTTSLVQCEAGKTSHVNLGVGNTIRVKLELLEDTLDVDWTHTSVTIMPEWDAPFPENVLQEDSFEAKQAWYQEWLKTPEGQAYEDQRHDLSSLYFRGIKVDADGSFIVRGIVQAKWRLYIQPPTKSPIEALAKQTRVNIDLSDGPHMGFSNVYYQRRGQYIQVETPFGQ